MPDTDERKEDDSVSRDLMVHSDLDRVALARFRVYASLRAFPFVGIGSYDAKQRRGPSIVH